MQEFSIVVGRDLLMIVGFIVVVAIAAIVVMASGAARRRAEADLRQHHIADTVERLAQAQAELTGRLSESHTSVSERLDGLGKRVGDSLILQTEKTGERLEVLQRRLAVIDAAQKNITDLSQQMVGLQDILSNKQARGAFGEIQLNDLVKAALPAHAYAFQVTMSNRARADCLLTLPNPPGPIAIDSKFPLESYERLQQADNDDARKIAGRTFQADVSKHVKDIAERYIIPGETAESALMFLPSEAIYAELHANFRNVIEESFRRRVWIVSPTTLMATLNTVRAVLRDVHMREQADVIQGEVRKLLEDMGRLDERVDMLRKQFDTASKTLDKVRTSTDRVTLYGNRIDQLQLGDEDDAPTIEPPSVRLVSDS